MNSFSNLVDRIYALLTKGCNIVVHCHAGIGRTGLTICCFAKRYMKETLGDQDPITWMRGLVRGAVQSKQQEIFVTKF